MNYQIEGTQLPESLKLLGVEECNRMYLEAVRPILQQRVNVYADKFRMLSSVSSSIPGKWLTSRNPPTKKIMECLSHDHPCNDVVLVGPTQWAKTEIILNLMFQKMDQAPCSILVVQPTINDAKKFVKQRVESAIKLMPSIRDKIGGGDNKKGGDAMFYKEIAGGALMIGWSNSVSNLSSTPIFILILDECDKYAFDCDGQGCPIAIADARTENFPNAKRFYTSTPANKHDSRIWPRFLAGDQQLYLVPCWHCNKMFWMDLDTLEWETTESGILISESIRMKCPACEYENEERHRTQMLENGEWVAQNPGGDYPSFRVNDLHKPAPWGSWLKYVMGYRKAKRSVHTYKVWVNTKRALPWEEEGAKAENEKLFARREVYRVQVPNGVLIITAGVDVQDDRLELEFVGWGRGWENWGISRSVLWGNTSASGVWNDLDFHLSGGFQRGDGSIQYMAAACIDAMGHRTEEVYQFCKPREARRIFPIRGVGGDGLPILGRVTRRHRTGVYLFPMGTDTAKDELLASLMVEEVGEKYCHFPAIAEYDEEFFKQLASHSKVLIYKENRPTYKWMQMRERDEALDIRNMARAALEITSVDLDNMTEPYLAQPEEFTPRRARNRGSRGVQF